MSENGKTATEPKQRRYGAPRPKAKVIGRIMTSGRRGKRYLTELGTLMQREDGLYLIILKALPINPDWDGFCHVLPLDYVRKAEQPLKLSDYGGDFGNEQTD